MFFTDYGPRVATSAVIGLALLLGVSPLVITRVVISWLEEAKR